MLLLSNQNKTKKNKEKGIGKPSAMCITNDDAISNGSKCNNVMGKKKMFEEGKGNDEKIITIEEKK